jgi:hypothetical protein
MSRSVTHRLSAGALIVGLLAACGSGETSREQSRQDSKDAKMMAPPEPAPKRARLSAYDPQIIENARAMLADGRETFRRDTFGDEAFWGDTLQLHRAIESAVAPKTALAVGLKVDSEALPDELVAKIKKNEVNMDDPATTVALLKLNAVVGVQGFFDEGGRMKSVGITCALCHSTVDDSFSPGIGRRLDGWPNRDLDVGKIVSLAPNLDPFAKLLGVDVATVKKVLLSWGPGKYDAELDKDGKAFRPDGKPAATLLPPAFGLAGVNLHTYTGFGSVTYWNSYVANTQMHGSGVFFDARLKDADQFPVAARSGSWNTRAKQDRVTPKLASLHFYQLSLPAPEPPAGSYDRAAFQRGQKIFEGKAKCATCHVPPLFTEPGNNLHSPAEIGIDDFQAERSPTKSYRTTPLRGLWSHQKGGFYHDGRFPKLDDVINHYNDHFKLQLSDEERKDLVQFLLGL